jgi:signal recognition particle receptor subunit beta
MAAIDSRLSSLGPEPSLLIAISLFWAYLCVQLIKLFTGKTSRSAIREKTSENVGAYNETIVLCGPCGAGKTRIFYQVCLDETDLPTVTSVQANIGIPPSTGVRFIDWPGHASTNLMHDEVFATVLRERVRFVLVIDSTQPVGTAADTLHQIFQYYYSKHGKTARQTGKSVFGLGGSKEAPIIFVACHKQDVSKAKNPRRIQLQLRTELERLLQAQQASSTAPTYWPAGTPVQWDQLEEAIGCRLAWCPTHCKGGDGLDTLMSFCMTGRMTDDGKDAS